MLVVDDEESVARALERWLKRRPAVTVRVLLDPSGLAAALAEFQPTHVVSDLYMPASSGLEVLAQAQRLAPQAVRVLLSGALEGVAPEALAALHPVRLLAKPWDSKTLAVDLGLE